MTKVMEMKILDSSPFKGYIERPFYILIGITSLVIMEYIGYI